MSKESIKVVQVGFGQLGIKICQFIQQRKGIQVVGVIDVNPQLIGKDVGEIIGMGHQGIKIVSDIDQISWDKRPDVAIVTTVPSIQEIAPLVEQLITRKINVVSTCEEMSYSWNTEPSLSYKLDEIAKIYNVSIVGTGVNPGFLMDSLPAFLTSVSQKVDSIEVNRFQDAGQRRKPFQDKVGAGLDLDEFYERKEKGSLRHVGLTESMQFIAGRLGWSLDKTEDIINPVIAKSEIKFDGETIPEGNALGVCQVGNGYVSGEKKISMTFQAAIGEEDSYDEVIIEGKPRIVSRIGSAEKLSHFK